MKTKIILPILLMIIVIASLGFFLKDFSPVSKYPKSSGEPVVVKKQTSSFIKKEKDTNNTYQPNLPDNSLKNDNYTTDDEYVYFKGEIVEGADPATLYAPAYARGYEFHAIDKNNAYFFGRLIPNTDVQTYEFLDNEYSRDKNSAYFREFRLENSDPSTFEILGQSYSKDTNNVYYRSTRLVRAHADTFEITRGKYDAKDKYFSYNRGIREEGDDGIFFVLTDGYAIDDRSAYYREESIIGSDPETFVIDEKFKIYSRDKNNAYYRGKLIEDSDSATFEVLNEEYSKDKKHAYLKGVAIENSDGSSFELLAYNYSKDKNNVYFEGGLLEGIDAPTFVVMNDSYVKDDYSAYYRNKKIEGSDGKSFKLIDSMYAEDKDHSYKSGKLLETGDKKITVITSQYYKTADSVYYLDKVISGADPATFELFINMSSYNDNNIVIDPNKSNSYTNGYAKDKNNIYYKGELIKDADRETFQLQENNLATDKNYVWSNSKIIEGSSGGSFKKLDKQFAVDDAFVYRGGNKVEGSDGKTFEILNKIYCKDKNNVYILKCTYSDDFGMNRSCSFNILKDAKPFTFEAFGGYGRDKYSVFYLGEKMSDTDSMSFKTDKFGDNYSDWGVDNKHVYFRGNIVKEADAKTFVIDSETRGRDKNNKFYYGAIDKPKE